ncbi:c-type cytochrome [Ideonella sp.]|jgi:mono/diheme cytochrome c family protein|uniref:c-type cytochrome n=1 Tax=Ideonella sp. TaxID=1929293 RepID=UPI0037C1A958
MTRLRQVMRALAALALLVALVLAALVARELWGGPTRAGAEAANPLRDAATLERGAYLARLGNCAGCHTAQGGPALAGGRPLATPFGTVYTSNLTPDAETGLGRWSAEDFWHAMHHGRGRDGRLLLPAFPFTAFIHLARADSDALYAYLHSLPAVQQEAPAHQLGFPYNTQVAQAVWRLLYFKAVTEPQVALSEMTTPLQRGAALVNGLGHCAACHASRSALGGQSGGLVGGHMPGEGWWSPPLALPAGEAAAQGLVQLLQTGQGPQGTVSGPMAEVVLHSMQHWQTDDLRAVALYLQSLPAVPAAQVAAPAAPELLAQGRSLYTTHCADCHGVQGQGAVDAYPPLAGNPTVLQPTAINLMLKVRQGGFAPATAAHPQPYGMPPLDLSDAEMAALLSFIRQSWGHQASAVSELDVWRWSTKH